MTRHLLTLGGLVLAASLCVGPALAAQGNAGMTAADVPAPNVSIPTYPALALLDVDGSKLASVSDTRDLGIQLGNLIGANGSLNSGVAFGGRPFWWLNPGMTLDQYSNAGAIGAGFIERDNSRLDGTNRFERILARTNLSVATIEADDGIRLGIGLTTQLLDAQDPRYDLHNAFCINSALRGFSAVHFDLEAEINRRLEADFHAAHGVYFDATNRDHQPLWNALETRRRADIVSELNVRNQQLTAAAARSQAGYEHCAGLMRDRFARSWGWTVGVGSTFQSSGQFTDLDQEQLAMWSALSYPINRQIAADQFVNIGSATLFVRQNIDQAVDAPGGGGETEADSLEVAFLVATSEENRWRLDAHYTHIEREYHDAMFADESFERYGLGLQYRITEAFAIEVSGGAITGSAMDDGDFLNIEFKLDWEKLGLLGG